MKNVQPKLTSIEQSSLLEKCTSNALLSEELAKLGMVSDNLSYINNPELRIPPVSYEWLDDKTRVPNNIPAVSFFAGAGGFDVGFHCAGYENLASIEINQIFCETLRYNFPKKMVIGPPNYSGDVRDRTLIAQLLREKIEVEQSFEGVFHGGPPCQPFSIASNQRFSKNGDNFKRIGFEHQEYGNLLTDYLWFILEFRPRVFIIENVAGFMELDKGQQVRNALDTLIDAGYSVSNPQVFDLADFGVPQHRNRFIVVGSRTGHIFRFPSKNRQLVPCSEVFKKDLNGVLNHEIRAHKPESLLRYINLAFGKRDKLGRVDRLNPAKPSKTVIAGGTKGGGRSHLHPFIPRTISVRECARLQTFPDWYVFTGAIARQFTQVGNAVPPLFAYKLAVEIQKQFFDNPSENVEVVSHPKFESTLFEEFA